MEFSFPRLVVFCLLLSFTPTKRYEEVDGVRKEKERLTTDCLSYTISHILGIDWLANQLLYLFSPHHHRVVERMVDGGLRDRELVRDRKNHQRHSRNPSVGRLFSFDRWGLMEWLWLMVFPLLLLSLISSSSISHPSNGPSA